MAIVAMQVFCYRLILREESELHASQGEQYERYRKVVPRLLSFGILGASLLLLWFSSVLLQKNSNPQA